MTGAAGVRAAGGVLVSTTGLPTLAADVVTAAADAFDEGDEDGEAEATAVVEAAAVDVGSVARAVDDGASPEAGAALSSGDDALAVLECRKNITPVTMSPTRTSTPPAAARIARGADERGAAPVFDEIGYSSTVA